MVGRIFARRSDKNKSILILRVTMEMRLVLGLVKSRFFFERRKIKRSCWEIVLKEVWL